MDNVEIARNISENELSTELVNVKFTNNESTDVRVSESSIEQDILSNTKSSDIDSSSIIPRLSWGDIGEAENEEREREREKKLTKRAKKSKGLENKIKHRKSIDDDTDDNDDAFISDKKNKLPIDLSIVKSISTNTTKLIIADNNILLMVNIETLEHLPEFYTNSLNDKTTYNSLVNLKELRQVIQEYYINLFKEPTSIPDNAKKYISTDIILIIYINTYKEIKSGVPEADFKYPVPSNHYIYYKVSKLLHMDNGNIIKEDNINIAPELLSNDFFKKIEAMKYEQNNDIRWIDKRLSLISGCIRTPIISWIKEFIDDN
jgi:hypothetical protein